MSDPLCHHQLFVTLVCLSREKLRQQGADPAFMKMLHSLDKCNMNFEEKWGEVQRQIAGKADFR